MSARASSLARIQQGMVLGLVACAAAWCFWRWPSSPWQAAAGILACLLAHAPVLALEQLLLRVTWGLDPAPAPTLREQVVAWARESCQGLRVFAWRQPFAWRHPEDWVPDAHPARGIVFIHGFVCNRGFWSPWLQRCRRQGTPCVAVNLEPVQGPIESYLQSVDIAVQRLIQTTGKPPVLVAHSMGGLVARAWLRDNAANRARVAHIVTIGTPHHGTWLARFSHLPNGRQMSIASPWLDRLNASHASEPPLFTCWWSNTDNIVFPPTTATLPGASNRLLRGAGHVDLAFRDEVIDSTLAMVRAL